MASDSGEPRVTLTPEETALLNQCKKEAYMFRAIPLGLFSSSIYFFSLKFGRLASASARTRILVGSSIVPACVLYATFQSYGTFIKRLETLEHSPLWEQVKKNRGVREAPAETDDSWGAPAQEDRSLFPKEPVSSYDYSPSRDIFAGDDTSKQRRPSIFDDPPRTSSDYQRDTSFSSQSFDWNQSNTLDSKTDKPPTFASYKDRREFYRKNPKAESRYDPFAPPDLKKDKGPAEQNSSH